MTVFDRIWKGLDTHGYALASDYEFGWDDQFRKHLLYRYFDGGELRCDKPDVPADRERARDVVRYHWRHEEGQRDQLELRAHDTIAIIDRGNQPGTREYHRVQTLDDPRFAEWLRMVPQLVPPHRRRARGTFGVNLLRTHTLVVTGPHRDHEEFIVTYVVDRRGGGAMSQLHDPDSMSVIFQRRLEPGDLLIFQDDRFLHSVTPLIAPPHGSARRDALVCTVDYPGSYALCDS